MYGAVVYLHFKYAVLLAGILHLQMINVRCYQAPSAAAAQE